MTWKLLHITEDKASNGDSVVYNRQTVGEWSDSIVQRAAWEISNLIDDEAFTDANAKLKEFLPDPIKEAL